MIIYGTNYVEDIARARKAIVAELGRRAAAKDQFVIVPADEYLKNWIKPQVNYFAGFGNMACPICRTGKLGYTRSAFNGQMHAGCETKNCVKWIE